MRGARPPPLKRSTARFERAKNAVSGRGGSIQKWQRRKEIVARAFLIIFRGICFCQLKDINIILTEKASKLREKACVGGLMERSIDEENDRSSIHANS